MTGTEPPLYRIRKMDTGWAVLRLQPVRNEVYFVIQDGFESAEDALAWIDERKDGTGHPGFESRQVARQLLVGQEVDLNTRHENESGNE